MTRLFGMFGLVLLVFAGVGEGAGAGDISAARKPSPQEASCISCHGRGGTASAPSIAAQGKEYFAKAMQDFRSGARAGSPMAAVAKPLSDGKIVELAAFFSTLERAKAMQGEKSEAYRKGRDRAAICARCHGPQGISPDPHLPSLASQRKEYLVKALRDFRGGGRSDERMTPVAGPLSDEDLDNLAEFFSAQPATE